MRFHIVPLMIFALFAPMNAALAEKATSEQIRCAIDLHEEAKNDLRNWTVEKFLEASGKDPKSLSPNVLQSAKKAHRLAKEVFADLLDSVVKSIKFFSSQDTELKILADLSMGSSLAKQGIISLHERGEFIRKCGDWLFADGECSFSKEEDKKGMPDSGKEKTMSDCTEKNYYGSFPKGGNCTYYGCFPKGGDCSYYGCWPQGGSCNYYGCTTQGECDYHGCPNRIAKDSYQCKSMSDTSKEKTMSNCTEKNHYGSFPKGGDCTHYGCFPQGGNCSHYGCWPQGGSCNHYGCTAQGECDYRGCPNPIPKDSYKCK